MEKSIRDWNRSLHSIPFYDVFSGCISLRRQEKEKRIQIYLKFVVKLNLYNVFALAGLGRHS